MRLVAQQSLARPWESPSSQRARQRLGSKTTAAQEPPLGRNVPLFKQPFSRARSTHRCGGIERNGTIRVGLPLARILASREENTPKAIHIRVA
jgi:hypothetical protein